MDFADAERLAAQAAQRHVPSTPEAPRADAVARVLFLQRSVGNRAVSSLLAPARTTPRVEVASTAPSVSVPASLAERAATHGSVEFGHSSDQTRTVEHLGRDARERPGERASWRGQTLVLPGVDPSRLDARSEAAFAAGLRDTLPFQRFRLVPLGDALALEGKINPWVRLVDDAGIDQIELSNAPSDARPDGENWTWVGPVTELQASMPRPASAAELGSSPRGYTVPWLDEGPDRDSSTVVLPMKTKFYKDSTRLQHAGGLPSLPGGAINEGETLNHGIVRELGEEVRAPHGPAFKQRLIAKDVAHAQVGPANLYFAESFITPIHHGTPAEADVPGEDTRGWVAVDITQLGVTPADPLDTIAVKIANECLKRMGTGWPYIATPQLQEYFKSGSIRFLTSNVRMRLELVYDRTVADITAGRPAADHRTAQAAHRDYMDEVGRLRVARPSGAPNRAALAAQADYKAGLAEMQAGQMIAETANPAAQAARDDYEAAIKALQADDKVADNDAALAARQTYQAIQRQPAPRLGATGTALLRDSRFAGFIAIGLLALGIAFWQWIARTMEPQQRSLGE